MITLEIRITSIERKRVELTQTLAYLKKDMQRYCSNMMITEDDCLICFSAEFISIEQLTEMLLGDEILILSGSITSLGEKSEITISKAKTRTTFTDLKQVRQDYLKQKKKMLIS